MNRTVVNGLAGFALAVYLVMVLRNGKIGPLMLALSDERPFAKYMLAFLVWKLFIYTTSGKPQALIEASGNVAVITALIIGAKENSAGMQKLSDELTKLLG